MQQTVENVRKQHIPKKGTGIQKKNTFELISSLNKNLYSNRFEKIENAIQYAESLLKIAHGLFPGKTASLRFTEGHSVMDLIFQLEFIINEIENDYSYYNDQYRVSIYSHSDEDYGHISIGVPNISPDMIYIFYMDWIYNFESEEMKIGFANVCNNYLNFTHACNIDLSLRKPNSGIGPFYTHCQMEAESFAGDDDCEDDRFDISAKQMAKFIKNENKEIKKVFREIKKYLRKPYSKFKNYEPKNIWEQDVKNYMEKLNTLLPIGFSEFVPSDYGFDLGGMEPEYFFRIFPCSDKFSDYEIESTEHYSREGVVSLEAFIHMKKAAPDFQSYERDIKNFNDTLKYLDLLITKISS